MNLKVIMITAALWIVSLFAVSEWYYGKGWDEGRAALVTQQRQQARARLTKQVTRQQQDDTRGAAAEQKGATRTVTITQEVVKYVKTPGRNVCTFDEARVKLKQAAVDNANHIEGYDHE
ncbi:hypothetical protein IF157_21550 [Salmonella enterica subsp. enterica serovar Typhimurium]|uniref:Spanin n=4 Tax=root TaxID=1 RepID=A0A5S9BGT1_9CAUD|nr:hypothetical protein [Salmonella enterica]YP_010582277.1 hypothetical protein PF620_gp44 [Salmonella phage TS6]YP_010582422.1 hypothetical protein PF622_gp49 [Salmonella phage vB_STM-ZS]WOZ15100.1 hypothetical protein [Salmonella phage STP-1]AZF89087.1 hypothetical protein AP6_044 [Salmonella phage TS6]EAN1947202.1 hypothetical protein [Salmonella enterica]EAW4292497.1 hypothetical protein [Salmonella enterica]EAW4306435.1 hypothetical protein [Salmonella enterica]